jgi:hypothetical protein
MGPPPPLQASVYDILEVAPPDKRVSRGVQRLTILLVFLNTMALILSFTDVFKRPRSPYRPLSATWTSGSTGTDISCRDSVGKRSLHRLIDFAASERESYQKGCRKQQGWKPAKSRSFLQRFGS